METLTFDERLFLLLNFDGGVVTDHIMSAVSGYVMWIPLYLFILVAVQRKYGWKTLAAFVLCFAIAMALADDEHPNGQIIPFDEMTEEQFIKAYSPILVRFLGKTTFVSFLQSKKTSGPSLRPVRT